MENDFFSPATQALPQTDGVSVFPIFAWILGILVFVGMMSFVAMRLRKFFRRPEFLGMSKEELAKRWKEIEALTERPDEMSYKMAILEADKLLDFGLKSIGCSGNTLGERLRFITNRYPNLHRVWPAHILRNKLMHEASFHLNRGQAKRAIGQFRDALRELSLF